MLWYAIEPICLSSVLVTSAHVHDSQVGWLLILLSAILYSFRVWIVYADAAYFDSRMFKVVHTSCMRILPSTTTCVAAENVN